MKQFIYAITMSAVLTYLLAPTPALAADYEKIRRELDILSDFIVRTVRDSDDCERCTVKLRSHYLAQQGALFQIRRSGSHGFVTIHSDHDSSSFFLPAVPAIPDIKDIHVADEMEDTLLSVEDALSDIEMDVEIVLDAPDADEQDSSFWSWNWDDNSQSEESRAYRDSVRKNREAQRALRQLERKMRRAEKEEMKALEKQHEKLKDEYADVRKEYTELAEKHKENIRLIKIKREKKIKERLAESQEKNEQTKALVLGTLCEYQATLKSLPEDEYVTLIFEGMEEQSKSNVMIFEKAALENCSPDKDKMESVALKYVM